MKFKEGQVVNCKCKIKVEDDEQNYPGTIWLISASKIVVLDPDGYLHCCDYGQVYEQK